MLTYRQLTEGKSKFSIDEIFRTQILFIKKIYCNAYTLTESLVVRVDVSS